MTVKLQVFVFRDGWIQSLHDVLKIQFAPLYPLSSALLWGLPPRWVLPSQKQKGHKLRYPYGNTGIFAPNSIKIPGLCVIGIMQVPDLSLHLWSGDENA